MSITYRFSPLPPPSPARSLANMHGPISPTSSSSGSTRSSPLSGSPQSTVHAQLPSYPASYQGSGGNYNFQQTQYNGGYDGYGHHVSQLASHSPPMGAIVSHSSFSRPPLRLRVFFSHTDESRLTGASFFYFVAYRRRPRGSICICSRWAGSLPSAWTMSSRARCSRPEARRLALDVWARVCRQGHLLVSTTDTRLARSRDTSGWARLWACDDCYRIRRPTVPLSLSHFTRVESKENLFLSAEGKAHSGEKAISSGEKFFTTPPRAAVPSAFLLHSNRKALDALARYLRQTKALFRPSHTHTHTHTHTLRSLLCALSRPDSFFYMLSLPLFSASHSLFPPITPKSRNPHPPPR